MNQPATPESVPLQRRVRAPHPERAAFERWASQNGYSVDKVSNAIGPDGLEVYDDPRTHAAWWAWQAARPKRAAVGRLINLAADCAQRKPLRGLEPLTEVTHIGHRQFARAYEQVDEAVRKLACDLRDAADAL